MGITTSMARQQGSYAAVCVMREVFNDGCGWLGVGMVSKKCASQCKRSKSHDPLSMLLLSRRSSSKEGKAREQLHTLLVCHDAAGKFCNNIAVDASVGKEG